MKRNEALARLEAMRDEAREMNGRLDAMLGDARCLSRLAIVRASARVRYAAEHPDATMDQIDRAGEVACPMPCGACR